MLQNSLGLNGAAGNAAAVNAFQASPGYQYQVQQATDAAQRSAASSGILGSGSTLAAVTALGSNLANQQYANWRSSLSGLGTQGLSAANAVIGANTAAGSQLGTGATTGANLYQSTEQNTGVLRQPRQRARHGQSDHGHPTR